MLLMMAAFVQLASAVQIKRPLLAIQTEMNPKFCDSGRQNAMSLLTGVRQYEQANPLTLKSEKEIDDWIECFATPQSVNNYKKAKNLLKHAEKEFGISYAMMACKIWQETHWVSDQISSENARSLVQIVPDQIQTLKNVMQTASNPPASLSHYIKWNKQYNAAIEEVQKYQAVVQQFTFKHGIDGKVHADLCIQQKDCLKKNMRPEFPRVCMAMDEKKVRAEDCTKEPLYAGENYALLLANQRADSIAKKINKERESNELARNYDHGVVLNSAWQNWLLKNNLIKEDDLTNPKSAQKLLNICHNNQCDDSSAENLKRSIGAGALNSLYLMVKLDDDLTMKHLKDNDSISYSENEFQLIMATAYNSGQSGPIMGLNPDESGYQNKRMKSFLENLRAREGYGSKGWGQTVCYVANMDACMRPGNMRPVNNERPTGGGPMCSKRVGEDLASCK